MRFNVVCNFTQYDLDVVLIQDMTMLHVNIPELLLLCLHSRLILLIIHIINRNTMRTTIRVSSSRCFSTNLFIRHIPPSFFLEAIGKIQKTYKKIWNSSWNWSLEPIPIPSKCAARFMIIEFFVFVVKKPDIVDLLLIYSTSNTERNNKKSYLVIFYIARKMRNFNIYLDYNETILFIINLHSKSYGRLFGRIYNSNKVFPISYLKDV